MTVTREHVVGKEGSPRSRSTIESWRRMSIN